MSALAATVLRERRLRLRVSWGPVTTALILVGLIIADIKLQPALLDSYQIGLEIQTALPLVLVSAAQTLVVLVRGIDLSVGGMMVVANVLTATWLGPHDSRLWLLAPVLLIGVSMGGFNGVLVTYLRFEPFVATLATWTIFNGIALWLLATDGGAPPPKLAEVVISNVGPIPDSYIILAAVLLVWWWLKGTRFGRQMYAVGSDEERAHLNGVRIRGVKIGVYALAGLAAAIGGIYLCASTSSGTPTAGNGYILQSVAAVVIGGTSLLGGRGGVGLTTMAVFVLVLIADIVSALNLSVWVSVAAQFGLLLAVVAVRSFIETRRAREDEAG